ncbi:hypothetical protein [Bradyrhizobium septentrionale]|uniref:Uncharacterized protein n=1 Tax=Bradyrhizobium septentrionale TaxID=1404411 RepID=A0A973VU69_9BRAD|nr:hypothetical protein [Bradyrhizobium septentrionale]UGY19393.1 hypothetical protein HAP48_0019220 [Bradyrhizobium septentrionale]UGY28123.1 hypothetical protein HU675_0015940 [Bradyrhizobium septentrionale]
MEWWHYALFAVVLIGCAFVVRGRRGKTSKEDEELNRRIDERVERLDLTRRDRDRDS